MNVFRPLYKLAGLACLISLFTAFSYGQNQTIVLPPIDVGATEFAQVNVMSSEVGWTHLADCKAMVTFYMRAAQHWNHKFTWGKSKCFQPNCLTLHWRY